MVGGDGTLLYLEELVPALEAPLLLLEVTTDLLPPAALLLARELGSPVHGMTNVGGKNGLYVQSTMSSIIMHLQYTLYT